MGPFEATIHMGPVQPALATQLGTDALKKKKKKRQERIFSELASAQHIVYMFCTKLSIFEVLGY